MSQLANQSPVFSLCFCPHLMLAFLHIFMFSDSLSHFSASSVFDDGYKMMNPKIKIHIIWALTGAQEIFVFPVPVQV